MNSYTANVLLLRRFTVAGPHPKVYEKGVQRHRMTPRFKRIGIKLSQNGRATGIAAEA